MRRLLPLAAVLLLIALPLSAAGRASPYHAGQFLVAAPGLGDPRFAQSVVLMLEHDADGALGLIVNKVLGEGELAALLRGFGLAPGEASARVRLQYGGPLSPDAVFVLHSDDYRGQDSRRVGDGVRLSSRADALQAVASGDGPADYMVLLGYAGWGPGQLEREFARGDWTTAPVEPRLLFSVPAEKLWQAARDRAGVRL